MVRCSAVLKPAACQCLAAGLCALFLRHSLFPCFSDAVAQVSARPSAAHSPCLLGRTTSRATSPATRAASQAGEQPAEDIAAGPPASEGGYASRLGALLRRSDPRLIFIGEESEAALQLLSLPAGAASEQEVARARLVVAATRHPAGGMIPKLLRPVAFSWMNVPLVMGFLLTHTLAGLVCMQMVNQSFNAAFNLANGSTSASSQRAVKRNYFFAAVFGCALAIAGHEVGNMLHVGSGLTKWVVPYLAVVGAGLVNIGFSRWEEITRGVMVTDKQGRSLCISRVAGRVAVVRAIFTRSLLLPLVALSLPSSLASLLCEAFPKLHASVAAARAVELLLVTVVLFLGLPACVALFPDTLQLSTRQLEPEAQAQIEEATRRHGLAEVPLQVYAYRGM